MRVHEEATGDRTERGQRDGHREAPHHRHLKPGEDDHERAGDHDGGAHIKMGRFIDDDQRGQAVANALPDLRISHCVEPKPNVVVLEARAVERAEATRVPPRARHEEGDAKRHHTGVKTAKSEPKLAHRLSQCHNRRRSPR